MLKFIVTSYTAQSEENSYRDGIISDHPSSFWDNRDCPAKGRFDTVADALRAVCKANCFDYDPDAWFVDEDGDNEPYFIGDVLVDANNAEASPAEVEAWKKGECRLWNCRLEVFIKKQEEALPLETYDYEAWRR